MDLWNGGPDLRRSEESFSSETNTKERRTTTTLESSQCSFHSPTFPLAVYQSPARITSLTVSAFTEKAAEARAEPTRIPTTSQKQFPVIETKLLFEPTQLVHAAPAFTSIFVQREREVVVVVLVIDNSLLATCLPDYLNRKRNSIFTQWQSVQYYSSLE